MTKKGEPHMIDDPIALALARVFYYTLLTIV